LALYPSYARVKRQYARHPLSVYTQLIELTLLIGQYHMVAFSLNSLGVPLDEGPQPLPPT
jgi:hypothetical protein